MGKCQNDQKTFFPSYSGMNHLNILDHDYIANLSDSDIVQLFLHGDLALSNTANFDLFSMAQTYIIDTSRF